MGCHSDCLNEADNCSAMVDFMGKASLRRDYGLRRCADHGPDGLERRVGWGVIGSNLRHIGQAPAA